MAVPISGRGKKRVERTQELRRSGAAGPHKNNATKRVTKQTIIRDNIEAEEQDNG